MVAAMSRLVRLRSASEMVGQRRIEPRIGPPRADLRLADRGEVLIEASFVRRSHLLFELAHFREVGVEHAAFAAQGPPLGRLAPFRFFKQRREDLAATTHRGQPHAVRRPGERILREGDLHRRVARVLAR